MPKNPIFDQARGRATHAMVESLFNSEGAYWDGDEFWTLNPTRTDSSVGSFSINGNTGLWSDFASGDKGDLIGLIHKSGRATSLVNAAEMILQGLGETAPTTTSKPYRDKPPKVAAIIPVPESALPSLEQRVKGQWARENRGTAVKSWAWRRADGGVWCATTRYERDGKKDVIPHYWGEDGKWHEGNPINSARPLYRSDQITKAPQGTKFLIVEGEKKVMKDVPGWLLTTWIGGASQWTKTDWAALEAAALRGDVLIWPDADDPGLKAGMGIAKRLPGAVLMDIKGRAQGWDLADAIDEGIDPVEFIRSCPRVPLSGPPEPDAKRADDPSLPFLCLGYDKTAYYFMRRSTRQIYSIGMGYFNSSKLGELAPLSWWGLMNMTTDQGGIKVAPAQDYLISLQHEVGFYDPKRIRGAGVWRDSQGIILNDGRRIITIDGRAFSYDEFPSSFYYVPSLVAFGEMAGPESTDEDGAQLEELFRAYEFEEDSMAILLMGWCLVSPFGGALKWRPHVWITGQKGSGKTWMIDHLVVPLCGPFAYIGSGKDTEAGIRWALDQDARPSIMAEMEPKSKAAREKIASILELARNASDDGSGSINISQAGGGTKSFRIRSMFAFSSKVMPIEDDAVSSRITKLELAKSKDEARKIKICNKLTSDLLDDPGRFTRRIFRALPRIIADIEYLRTEYRGAFRSQRAADQLAPLLATAWAVQSGKSIRTADDWLSRWVSDLSQESKLVQGDEDSFMAHLVALGLRDDENRIRTVAELLSQVAECKDSEGATLRLLERFGITLRRRTSGTWVLSIATELPALAERLRDTPWGDAYGAQVRRCPFALGSDTRPIRLAAGRHRCLDLDWEGFAARYIGMERGAQGELLDEVPF